MKLAKFCDPCRSSARRKNLKYTPTPEIDAMIREAWSGEKYHKKAAVTVVKRTGWPKWAVTRRAIKIGAARVVPKEKPWSKEEIEALEKFAWMSLEGIRKKLKALCGTTRTTTAVQLKRRRLHLLSSLDGYNTRKLAEMMGIDCHAILRWIKFGWLTAHRRGETGDLWFIPHPAVRKFILAHPEEVNLGKADRLWILDVLTNGAIGVRDAA